MPAIALSGMDSAEDRQRSRRAGFAVHLVKSIDLDALEGEVRRVLSLSTPVDRAWGGREHRLRQPPVSIAWTTRPRRSRSSERSAGRESQRALEDAAYALVTLPLTIWVWLVAAPPARLQGRFTPVLLAGSFAVRAT